MRRSLLVLCLLLWWLTVVACPTPSPLSEATDEPSADANGELIRAEVPQEISTPDAHQADTSDDFADVSQDTQPEATPTPDHSEATAPDRSEAITPEATRESSIEPLPEATPEAPPETPSDAGPAPRSSCTAGAVGPYVFGKVYWGRESYIQYIPGDMPLVFSAPHGGQLRPAEISERTQGTIIGDSNSLEITLEAAHVIYKATGHLPHVILNRLHRSRLDANREIMEAADGNRWAEQAWNSFHTYIDAAKAWVTQRCQRGHYFDFHTNAHAAQWTEFGHLLSSTQLKLPDATLQQATYRDRSSLKALVTWSGTSLPVLLRGPDSLGALLMKAGYKAVPSPTHPDPGSEDYFNGGYNTARHGSRNGGNIDGTQIESYTGFGRTNRSAYADKLAQSILTFVETHYGFALRTNTWKPPVHALCKGARPLQFDASGEIQLDDTTLGASDEFAAKVTCGKSNALAGPQTYYTIPLQAGRSYEITLTPSFPAQLVLFGSTCDLQQINQQCATSGLDGVSVAANATVTKTIQVATSASYTLAIDSLNPAWYGAFQLRVVRK